MAGKVHVRGLRETNRAFNNISGDLGDELRDGLALAAQPVKVTAETLAIQRIRNLHRSPAWAEQKIVVSRATAVVKMLPAKRSRRGARKRKNYADLMATRAMEPALEQNETRVTADVENVLDRLSRKNGF